MTHGFIDTYVVCGFIFVTLFIILVACIDRYKSRRWSRMVNAEYLARVASQATSFGPFEDQSRQPFPEFHWEVEAVHVADCFRGRKRVLRDQSGRIVARHYEQIVLADLVEVLSTVKAPLLLPPATA